MASVLLGNNTTETVASGGTVSVSVSYPSGYTYWSLVQANDCSTSASTGTTTGFSISSFTASSYSVTISGFNGSSFITSTISGNVTTLPPTPTDITFSAFSTTASANASVTVTTIGTPDVTLKIGQSINGATVSGYANSPAVFSQIRGSTNTYRYWAYNRRSATVRSGFYNELNGTAPYLATTASGSLSGVTTTTTSSVTLTVSGVPAGHEFKINGGTTGSTTVSTPTIGTHQFNLTVRRTQAGGGNPSGAFSGTVSTHSVTRSAATTNPPTSIAISPTSSTSQSANYTVTATAYGNTATSRSIRLGTSGAYSGNGATFTVTRGSATFQAYNTLNGINSIAYSQVFTIPYLGSEYADSSLTASSQTVGSTISSGTISFTAGNVNTYYQLIRSTDGTWPAATSSISPTANTTPYQSTTAQAGPTPLYSGLSEGTGLWPAAGGTFYYKLRVRLRSNYGGSGAQSALIWATPTITVTRAAAPAPPTSITLASSTEAASPTDVVVTVFGNTADARYVRVKNVGSYQTNGSDFTVTRGTATTFEAYNSLNGNNSNVVEFTETLGYLNNPDLDVTLPADFSIANSSTSDVTVSLADYSTNTYYRLYKTTSPGRWVASYNGSSTATPQFTLLYSDPNELPPTNTSWTYIIEGVHRAGAGGEDIAGGWEQAASPAQVIITRSAADSTPEPFDLGGPLPSAAQNSDFISNAITVEGLDTSTTSPISISGTGSPAPTYSKNSTTVYTATTGTVVNDDIIRVKVHSASSANAQVTGTLNIGGVTDTFSVTTASTGGSGSGITAPSANAYGLELRNASGTVVLQPAKRFTNYEGSSSITASTTEGSDKVSPWVTLANAGDSSKMVIFLELSQDKGNAYIQTRTDSGGQFRLVNPGTSTPITLSYVILRYG